MSLAVKVENVSKQYRLGKVGTGTLVHDLNRWWHLFRGREDPYLKVGDSNNRTIKAESDYVWALRNIDFEIEKGTAVGLIGSNGAGKSTLLKILSRTTTPTLGEIKIRGRVASLLEVGTGFHPELSGRDNIFLNGAILGMTRREIIQKFDEIVDFSGVSRYIDTPVKRYSSGMYVRLAFAVAAHLESEILIVDEVLAVGDSDFQKKCLGKMNQISRGEGRTVIFVSHNLASIKHLCQNGVLLEQGCLKMRGDIKDVIEGYFMDDTDDNSGMRSRIPESGSGYFLRWYVDEEKNFSVVSGRTSTIVFEFYSLKKIKNCELGLVLRNSDGMIIYGCNSRDYQGNYFDMELGTVQLKFSVVLPIIHGKYEVDIALVSNSEVLDQWIPNTKLTIKNTFESVLPENWRGILNTESHFHYVQVG